MRAPSAAALPENGPLPATDADRVSDAVTDGSIRCVLDDRGFLSFRGSDARSFLHSQLSTDVHRLPADASRLTSYSDARGRLLVVGRLHVHDDTFLLEMPADRLEPVRQQFAKYVLRADVRIEDASPEQARFGVAGHSAGIALGSAAGALPDEPGATAAPGNGIRVIRLAGPRPRWQVHGEAEAVRAVWDGLANHTVEVDSAQWRQLDIEAGIPAVHDGTAGHFVAQMVNLDLIGAVDFDKGCYPGQEVIARTHYLGRIKRRMQLLYLPDPGELPAPGTTVEQAGHHAGEVVEAAPAPGGGGVLLAVVRTDAADPLTIAGHTAERRPLPYRLDEVAA